MNKIESFTILVWFECEEGAKSVLYNVESKGCHKACAKLATQLYHTPFRSMRVISTENHIKIIKKRLLIQKHIELFQNGQLHLARLILKLLINKSIHIADIASYLN